MRENATPLERRWEIFTVIYIFFQPFGLFSSICLSAYHLLIYTIYKAEWVKLSQACWENGTHKNRWWHLFGFDIGSHHIAQAGFKNTHFFSFCLSLPTHWGHRPVPHHQAWHDLGFSKSSFTVEKCWVVCSVFPHAPSSFSLGWHSAFAKSLLWMMADMGALL